jgi:hypothetical protein
LLLKFIAETGDSSGTRRKGNVSRWKPLSVIKIKLYSVKISFTVKQAILRLSAAKAV